MIGIWCPFQLSDLYLSGLASRSISGLSSRQNRDFREGVDSHSDDFEVPAQHAAHDLHCQLREWGVAQKRRSAGSHLEEP
jgi:hypothetical protein